MIRAVIFDIDGTLIDSVDFHAESWQRTFRHFGKEIPFETVRHQIGKGSDQLLPVFWSREELDRLEQPLKDYRADLFHRDYLPRITAFPRVRELFERVRADGKRIALASSSKKEDLGRFKQIARITDLVDIETSGDDAEQSKPQPDIFEATLNRLGHPDPATAIVIGDTPYDARAAAKAGLRTIGVLCGGFPEPELRAAGCLALYRDPADLLEHYDDSPLAS